MLTFWSPRRRFCDHVTRRDFLRVGVVGRTDSKAALPRDRAVGAQNVLGTLYRALGIDPAQTLPDFTGRPMRLLDDGEPIAELV